MVDNVPSEGRSIPPDPLQESSKSSLDTVSKLVATTPSRPLTSPDSTGEVSKSSSSAVSSQPATTTPSQPLSETPIPTCERCPWDFSEHTLIGTSTSNVWSTTTDPLQLLNSINPPTSTYIPTKKYTIHEPAATVTVTATPKWSATLGSYDNLPVPQDAILIFLSAVLGWLVLWAIVWIRGNSAFRTFLVLTPCFLPSLLIYFYAEQMAALDLGPMANYNVLMAIAGVFMLASSILVLDTIGLFSLLREFWRALLEWWHGSGWTFGWGWKKGIWEDEDWIRGARSLRDLDRDYDIREEEAYAHFMRAQDRRHRRDMRYGRYL